ncbi:hypothetical protein D3Z47_12315 [Lachnospiraceae bacterium]|nr:hypothetical protein [Lachnospiraceae bacterium]
MKYISVNKASKIYEITKISFFYMTVEAVKTDLTMDDVPESEVWDIGEFEHYKVKLINSGGNAEIIDFEDWKEKHKKD